MSSSGLITGTPTDTGTFTYTVTVMDTCGSKPGTATCTICVTVPTPPPDTCTSTSTFDFTGGSSAVNGDAGNIRTFAAGNVNVKASAFSRNKKTGTWIKSYLGHYSHGLGVTDGKYNPNVEDGSNNTHTVDNMGDYDNYVLFEFSQAVTISSMYLGYVLADSDLTLMIGNYPDPYNNHLNLTQTSFNSISTEESLSDNGGNPRTAVVNNGKIQGTAILVAACTALRGK